MTTRMWEGVAAAGRLDDLVAWATANAPDGAQIFRSGDDRVVIIDPTSSLLAGPPTELLARAAHTWDFDEVAR